MNLMAGFAVYQLVNMVTGTALYSTTATQAEIEMANSNMMHRGLITRFVPSEPRSTHAHAV